jgi:phage baseplate assembly protein W
MKALSYPFRVGINGAITTTENYSDIVRGQLIDVLMTNFTERVMRPTYGSNLRAALFDPVDDLVKADAANLVDTRIKTWAPRVFVVNLGFSTEDGRPGVVFVDVAYRATEFDQTRELRMPAANFLSEETPV